MSFGNLIREHPFGVNMAHEADLTTDDIDQSKTSTWVEGGTLIVSIFTHDNENHVFEINLNSFTYSSDVESYDCPPAWL